MKIAISLVFILLGCTDYSKPFEIEREEEHCGDTFDPEVVAAIDAKMLGEALTRCLKAGYDKASPIQNTFSCDGGVYLHRYCFDGSNLSRYTCKENYICKNGDLSR